jgi:signal peptidase II
MTETAPVLTSSKSDRPWPTLLAAVVLLALDRLLKDAALASDRVDAVGNPVVAFRLFLNRGIAFSLPLSGWVYWVLAAAAGLALAWAWWRLWRSGRRAVAAAVAFILIGGLSNVIDRLAYGAVVDYLIFFGRSAVNLADGMIVGGAVAAYFLIRRKSAPS